MPRIIVVAFDVSPVLGSEASTAHQWLIALSERYEIEAFVSAKHEKGINSYSYSPNIHFNFVKTNDFIRCFLAKLNRFELINRIFISKIEKRLFSMLDSDKYSFVHFLTPAGIQTYNSLYKKKKFKYIIGPLGGGLIAPKALVSKTGIRNSIRESFRSFFLTSLKRNTNFIGYLQNASTIIIGTEYVRGYIPKEIHDKVIVQFDTLIDPGEFKPKVHSLGEEVEIISSGRLVPTKGFSFLIEAMALVSSLRPELARRLRVNIYGDGPDRSRLLKLIKKSDLENTVFLHRAIPREKLLIVLTEADIYCLPTIREPGGQAVLEAMGSGFPIITADYGGPRFSVTEECGIKIPTEDSEHFVERISEAIIELATDEVLRHRMGDAARQRAFQDFSLEAVKNRLPEIFKGLE